MPPVEHGPGGDASQSTVSPFLVFMAEVGGQFARGVVVGGVVILLGQIFFRLIKTWYRRRQYSAYDAIPDYDPHPDCDLTYDDADDSSYIPQPLPPDPSTSTTPTPSLTKIKTGEPPVVRHCRLAVRAMLHLVEISPEVIPQAQLFTYRGLRAGGHQRQASVPAFSNPTTAIPVHKDAVLGDKEKQRDEPSAVRPKDESVTPPRSSLADESISMSSGGTRRKSSKKPKTERTSLGRASGARAAVEILEKSIDEGKITAALPSSKNSSPHRHASDIFDNSSSRQEVSFEESRSHETQSGVTDDILAPIKDFKKDDAHNKAPRRTKLAKSFSDFSIGQATNRASFHADTDDAISEENVSRHSVSSTTSTPSARLRKPQSAMPLGRRSTSSAVEDGHRNSPASPTPVRSSIPATYFAADHAHEWTIPGFGRIRFTDHAPLPFKALRTLFGYSFDELNESLARAFSVEMTAGKSESVFFETHNNRYLLKTLRGAEMENLRSFLPAYISYILDNPGTLLPRYLGLYTFERLTTVNGPASYSSGAGPNGRSFGASGKHLHQQYQSSQIDDALGTRFTVVLMAHVFDTDLEIAAKFDFKGSNVGRQALPDDLSALRLPHNRNPFSSHSSTSTAASGSDTTTSGSSRGNRSISFSNLPSEITLKEVDYQRLIAIGGARRLIMGERAKLAVLAQLRSDVALLRKWEFMDYSLLIGVYRHPRKTAPPAPAAPPPPPLRAYSHDTFAQLPKHDKPTRGRSDSISSSSLTPPNENNLPTSQTTTPSSTPKRTAAAKLSPISIPSTSPRNPRTQGLSPTLQHLIPPVVNSYPLFQSALRMLDGWIAPPPEGQSEADEEGRDVSVTSTQNLRRTPSRGKDVAGKPVAADTSSVLSDLESQSEAVADTSGSRYSKSSVSTEDSERRYKYTFGGASEDAPSAPFHKHFKGGIRGLDLVDDDDVQYEVYYLGLIDILQKYNVIKWIERNLIKRPLFLHHQSSSITALPISSPVTHSPATSTPPITTMGIPASLSGLFGDHRDAQFTTPTKVASPVGDSQTASSSSFSTTDINKQALGSQSPEALRRPAGPLHHTWTYPTPRGTPPPPTQVSATPQTPTTNPMALLLPGMQNSETSVEEPGRYAERFVEFIEGILV